MSKNWRGVKGAAALVEEKDSRDSAGSDALHADWLMKMGEGRGRGKHEYAFSATPFRSHSTFGNASARPHVSSLLL
jgi:hypothetical protein